MFSFRKGLAAALGAGMLAVPVAAQAQIQFSGTTRGCFYVSNATPCSGSDFAANPSINQLSFAGVTAQSFGTTNSLGNGNNFVLGSFTLNTGAGNNSNFYDNRTFRLRVAFTQPAGTAGNPFVYEAVLDGTFASNTAGGIDIDFDNTLQTFTYSNASGSGSFQFRVDDLSLAVAGSSGVASIDTEDLTGDVRNATFTPAVSALATPEPSTYALLGAGLLGIAGAARRRRPA